MNLINTRNHRRRDTRNRIMKTKCRQQRRVDVTLSIFIIWVLRLSPPPSVLRSQPRQLDPVSSEWVTVSEWRHLCVCQSESEDKCPEIWNNATIDHFGKVYLIYRSLIYSHSILKVMHKWWMRAWCTNLAKSDLSQGPPVHFSGPRWHMGHMRLRHSHALWPGSKSHSWVF